MRMHKHKHKHKHMHIDMHMHMHMQHAHAHATCTCTCTYAHAHMHMHICTCTYAHAHMHISHHDFMCGSQRDMRGIGKGIGFGSLVRRTGPRPRATCTCTRSRRARPRTSSQCALLRLPPHRPACTYTSTHKLGRRVDAATKATVQKLPMLTVKAGPRDGEAWIKRMKEEYTALITVRMPACSHRMHPRQPCKSRAPISTKRSTRRPGMSGSRSSPTRLGRGGRAKFGTCTTC